MSINLYDLNTCTKVCEPPQQKNQKKNKGYLPIKVSSRMCQYRSIIKCILSKVSSKTSY